MGVVAIPKVELTPPSPVKIEVNSQQQFTCSITDQTNWRVVSFYDMSDPRISAVATFLNTGKCDFFPLSDDYKAIYEISCGTALGTFHFTIKSMTTGHHNKTVECEAQYGTGGSSDVFVRDSAVIIVIIPLQSINIFPDTSPITIQRGQIKRFTCDATSRPSTKVIWKMQRNEQSIEDMAPHAEQVNGMMVKSILNYTGIETDDKAVLFCIGQYNGSEIVSTKMKLEIIYAPNTELSIYQVPNGNIITGEIVTLTCKVSGGNPPPQLAWNCSGITRNNSAGNESSYSVMFTADKSINNIICNCYVSVHPIISYRPTKQQLIVVFYPPDKTLTIQSYPASTIFAGQNITLLCTVSGGNPLPTLSWNCTGTNHNSSSGPNASHSITFIVKANDNKRICTCSATQLITSYQHHVDHRLVIYYAPTESLSIEKIPERDIKSGDNVTLICTVPGGNPLATLSWNCIGNKTNHNSGSKAESRVVSTVDKTYNNMICTCSASHPVKSYRPTVQYKLVVYFSPDTNLTIQRTPAGGIISGKNVNLTCLASGGNPLASLSWNCSGTNTNYLAKNTVSHSVEIEVDESDNNKLCTCSATHPYFSSYKPTVENRLLVYFKPILDTAKSNSTTNIALSENDHLFITVSVKSNPHPIIKWTFLTLANIYACNKSVINSTSVIDGLHSSSNIFIENLNQNQFGEYTFMATNVVGIFLRKFNVLKKEKPMPPSYVHVVCKSTTAVVIFKATLIGNLPQELYIQYAVEGQDMTSIKVHMNDTNQAIEYTVTGLNPGRKYNFYILGVNLLGQTRSNQVKCLTDTLCNGEDMLALNKDNSDMLSAGIASLVVGLLFFVAATLFIFRKRFKKTYTKASKSEEYSDLQTSNPAFQDPYTSIQNPIESRHHQELIANTYEECGNASDAAAYQNIENMKSGNKKAEQNLGIYDNMKI